VFLLILKGLIVSYKLFKKKSLLTFIEISKDITCNVNYCSKKKVMNKSIYIYTTINITTVIAINIGSFIPQHITSKMHMQKKNFRTTVEYNQRSSDIQLSNDQTISIE